RETGAPRWELAQGSRSDCRRRWRRAARPGPSRGQDSRTGSRRARTCPENDPREAGGLQVGQSRRAGIQTDAVSVVQAFRPDVSMPARFLAWRQLQRLTLIRAKLKGAQQNKWTFVRTFICFS